MYTTYHACVPYESGIYMNWISTSIQEPKGACWGSILTPKGSDGRLKESPPTNKAGCARDLDQICHEHGGEVLPDSERRLHDQPHWLGFVLWLEDPALMVQIN